MLKHLLPAKTFEYFRHPLVLSLNRTKLHFLLFIKNPLIRKGWLIFPPFFLILVSILLSDQICVVKSRTFNDKDLLKAILCFVKRLHWFLPPAGHEFKLSYFILYVLVGLKKKKNPVMNHLFWRSIWCADFISRWVYNFMLWVCGYICDSNRAHTNLLIPKWMRKGWEKCFALS